MNEDKVKATLYRYLLTTLDNLEYAIVHDIDRNVILAGITDSKQFCDNTIKLMTTNGNDATSEEDIC